MIAAEALRETLAQHTIAAAPALVRADRGGLRCLACGHRCLVRPGRAGVCRVRFNRDGVLRAPGGYVAGVQVDPIEKKPFFHAYPGRDALSFGMLGCDLHCAYCQNWITSQALRDARAVAPVRACSAEDLVRLALVEGCPVVVSTYNEPLITADWAVQVFEHARAAGLACGFVSNGNATPEVLEFLRPFVSLYKVDLKSFRASSYRALGCTLENVLDTIVRLKEMGFWVEIVTLLAPGFNDEPDEIAEMARFIAGVSPDIPWHVTAFHPDYRMHDARAAEPDDLLRAWDAGKAAGLHYVYAGNRPGRVGDRENTVCPACGTLAIARQGFRVIENRLDGGHCPACGGLVAGAWETNPPLRRTGAARPRPLAP